MSYSVIFRRPKAISSSVKRAAMLWLLVLNASTLSAAAQPLPLDAVVLDKSFWEPNSVISVFFVNGDPQLNKHVLDTANEWSEFASIKFVQMQSSAAQIRVLFDSRHSNASHIGTNALAIPATQPTMWLKFGVERGTVLHEFGHALGLKHEQAHPDANIPFDRDAIYADLLGPPPKWSKEQIDANFFGVGTPFRTYDRESIMHYAIPNKWTIGDFEIEGNTELSGNDKISISHIYPQRKLGGTSLYSRSFSSNQFGTYSSLPVSSAGNMRGWTLKRGNSSYVYARNGETVLVTRRFDGRIFGQIELQERFSSADNIRGWDWDGNVATYIVYDKGSRTSTLLRRSFDGVTFGPVQKEIPFSSGDNLRGWSWDGATASYIAVVKGGSTLFIRSFDGDRFGPDVQFIQLSSADNITGWNWHEGISSYFVSH